MNFKINKDDNWWQYSYRSIIYGCNSLTSLVVDKDNPVYDSRNNCNAIIETASNTLIEGWEFSSIPNNITSIGDGALVYCSNMKSLNIPNSVASIASTAFWGCGLTSVIIPESVTYIGTYAFYCTSLQNMYCFAKTTPKTEGEMFFDTNLEKATLHVPAASIELYKATEPWKNFGHIGPLSESELTGINAIAVNVTNCKIYTLNGKQVDTLQKGVNIIHYPDGSTKKVFVK